MKYAWAQKQKIQEGFTIVELVIVIVVIAILASISIVAYNGIQERARDSVRASDANSIMEALMVHLAFNGEFPQETATSGVGGYEASTDAEGTFMEYLEGDYFSKVPVDPINTSAHYYRYYVYSPSQLSYYGCPTNKGELTVLYVIGFESASSTPASDEPLVCTNRTWSGGGTTYFQYAFEKG